MESRFAHLRQRDNSVSMLRVKMSRRRSQAQKENRERTVNTRRQLKSVQELELSSFDTSMANVSVAEGKKRNAQQPKNVAGEERLKQLQRWKERKALEKEKEKREKGRKAVFKTGLYHPKDTVESLPPVQAKETKINPAPVQSTRVTRSMKQQLVQKPLKLQDVNTVGKKFQPPVERTTRTRGAAPKPTPSPCKTKELATRGPSTRSANKPPVTAAPVSKDKPNDKCADLPTTRRKVVEVAPPPDKGQKSDDQITVPACVHEESISKPDIEQKACPVQSDEEEKMAVPNSSQEMSSFAPKGFLFQVPHGLNSFKFDPLTPRSADAFLTPSSSFTLPPAPVFDEPKAVEDKPSPKSLRHSPPASAVTESLTEATEEPQHNVAYFRAEIAIETDRLTGLCAQWEPKVDEESIPEEMRDRMRTVVGQARLLMKERFKQFSGLVDDCDFRRGEKVTTCTDLQGFWDMVYFQVEDINKKFDALKAAEACGWVEEHKPPPRQRKVVKKPAPAPAPSKPAGTKAAAKSRLAAAKAAMKARQQAAESTEQTSHALLEARSTDTVVNDGDFFKVKSPAKTPDSIRRSSRRSAMVLPQQSPSSNYLTPRRMTRRSLSLAQTPAQITANPQPKTPSCPYLVNKSPAQTTLPHAIPQPETSVSLHFSPIKEVPSDAPEQTEGAVFDPGQSIPSISVEEQDKPGEDLSLRILQSPCKSSVASPAPMPSFLSFTLSPCAAQLSSPVVSCTPRPVQSLLCTQDSLVNTPESCDHEDMPGVDFERYLQPSQKDSLSPRRPFAMESPVAMDVDMESPRGQPESPLTLQETVFCTLPYVPTPVSFQSPQTAESALLPFTPELKDRIRQSVCPADLMVFTPPL